MLERLGKTRLVAIQAVLVSCLTDDLRRPPWRGNPNPLAGHCYVASEALYHILGQVDLKPMFLRHLGCPHWFLLRKDGVVIDVTAKQFKTVPDYSKAVGKGFLTKQPSRRARFVIKRFYELARLS